MTKQAVIDAINALDQTASEAARPFLRSESAWERSMERTFAAQRAERLALEDACAASGGHAHWHPKDACCVCGFDKNAAKTQTARNLRKTR